jgi:hypothetical protein
MSRILKFSLCFAVLVCITGIAYAATVNCSPGAACFGTASADSITGSASADVIYAFQGGADIVVGNAGNDKIWVNDGDTTDKVYCNDGADTVYYDVGDTISTADCEVRTPSAPHPSSPAGSSSCPTGSTNVTTTSTAKLTPNDNIADNANLQTQITNAPANAVLCFPAGTYDLSNQVDVRNNGLTLHALPGAKLKRAPTSASDMMFRFIESSNTVVKGFEIDGGRVGDTWVEHGIAFWVISAHNADFDNNKFSNVMGDGIYYGRSSTDTAHECNTEIDVTNNTFNGQSASRNAISLICGDNFNVSNNKIYKWTRNDMPGGIDLEPNDSTDRLDNAIVSDNLIDNTGGVTPTSRWYNHGIQIGMNYNGAHGTNVVIEDNEMKGPMSNGVYMASEGTDSHTVRNNNIHDIGPNAFAGLMNEGNSNFTGNTVKNVNSTGSGYCFYSWEGSPTQSGNTYTGCV